MNAIYVVKRKSKTEKPYILLYLDLEYKELAISFNDNDIAQIIDCKVSDLYSMDFDVPRHVANLEVL